VDLLQLLVMLAHQQQQQRQGRAPSGYRQPGRGQGVDRSSSPLAQQANAWMRQNYFNPGWIGRDTTPGAGAGFGFAGFTRGTNLDPYRNPQVGYAGFMHGGGVNPRQSGFESLAQMSGDAGPNSMSAWLDPIYARENVIGPGEGDPLFGKAPRYGAGAGDQWHDWFSRGTSLEGMDRSFRGDYGTGGTGAQVNWLV